MPAPQAFQAEELVLARHEPPTVSQRPVHHHDAYLLFCTVAILAAVVGAFILLFCDQDCLGHTLLIGGDAAVIAGFVTYVRRLG